MFDSTVTRGQPSDFVVATVMPGWAEALQLMSPGDRWELYLPARLGYGSKGVQGSIPPGATLIFDMTLMDVVADTSGPRGLLDLPLPTLLGVAFLICVASFIIVAFLVTRGPPTKVVRASHILVSPNDEVTCDDMKRELDGLQDPAEVAKKFAELAGKFSRCTSGRRGGSLGKLAPGSTVPAFDEVCWSAPVGVVQGPVETEYGLHLILISERWTPGDDQKTAPEDDQKTSRAKQKTG